MITRRDCLLLLAELKQKGVNTDIQVKKCLETLNPDISVIKFINDHRRFEVNSFFEKLRKSYNAKKSNLYKNIVTCDEIDCSESVLTTLSALLLQINLFRKEFSNDTLFLRQARAEEIAACLLEYYKSFDLVPCIKVLQIIKADLKAFEYINKEMQ